MAKCDKCNKENGRRIKMASGQKICRKCYNENKENLKEVYGLKSIEELIKDNN